MLSIQDYILEEIGRIKLLEAQHRGDYETLLEYKKIHQENVLNFIGDVSIRNSEGKGRGIFADKDIKEGDLIMVDKPISSIERKKDDGFKLKFDKNSDPANNISMFEKVYNDQIRACIEVS